jgi:hypothetical protein
MRAIKDIHVSVPEYIRIVGYNKHYLIIEKKKETKEVIIMDIETMVLSRIKMVEVRRVRNNRTRYMCDRTILKTLKTITLKLEGDKNAKND